MVNPPTRFVCMLVIIAGLSTGTARAQWVITPTAAAENGGNMGQGRVPAKAIDRSGLYDVETINAELDDTHDTTRANQWGASWSSNRTFTLTLPEPSTIDRVYLWNAVEIGSRGIRTCDFAFSTNGGSSYANTTNLSFAQGGNTVQTRTFASQANVTDIQLSNFETYDGNTWINLAEIRFGRSLPAGQMQWLDWRVVATTNAITKDSVQLSSLLGGTNADVTLYWEAGTVTNASTHAGWDGRMGPVPEITGQIMRAVSNLTEGSGYTYAFYATNSTHGTEAWTDVGTFVTLEGEIIAEYQFEANAPSSTDDHRNTDASAISLGAGIAGSLRDNRIECAAAEVGTLNLGGLDYFGFTLDIPAGVRLTLTRFTYTYEEANSYRPAHTVWSGLTGEITTPSTRYVPPGQRNTGLNGTRTIVHNLGEAGDTFSDLSGTNIEFRVYMGDAAIGTGEQRFDDVRLYGIDSTPSVGAFLIVR